MKKIALKIHQGEALKRISERYPKVLDSILEYIQNAIDAAATVITVIIDKKTRTAVIRDNGKGISLSEFEGIMHSVLKSQKSEDCLGQFGMGMISAIGKCDHFAITTAGRKENRYYQWDFRCNELIDREIIDDIPYTYLPELAYSTESGKMGKVVRVNWRTEIKLFGLTKDRIISAIDIQELSSSISEKYNLALKKRGTVIDILVKDSDGTHRDRVKGLNYSGEKIEVVKNNLNEAGKFVAELFIARKQAGARKGKISVGINNDLFRIGIIDFIKSHRELFENETISVLTSGVFEGQFLIENCQLDPSRKRFVENDNLLTFIMEISKWVENIGSKLMSNLDDSNDDQLYQRTGLHAMLVIEQIVKNSPELFELIKSSKLGTVGINHFASRSKGETVEVSISTQGGVGEIKKREPTKSPNIIPLPKEDHPGHTPFLISGPKGKTRKIVSGHSTGLQFVFSEMPGSNDLWLYDRKTGCLCFNVRHPLWTEAEKRDLLLARFIEVVAIKALTLELMPSSFRDGAKEFIKNELPNSLTLLRNMLPKSGGLGRNVKKVKIA